MSTILDLISTPEDIIDVDIFTFLGLESLEQQQKDEMMKKMLETIEERVLERLVKSLSEEERLKMETLMTNDDTAGLEEFANSHSSDILLFFTEEAVFYKTELISIVSDPELGGAILNAEA